MNVPDEIPRSLYGSPLRDLDRWTSAQYIESAEFDGAERYPLAEPEEVPDVRFLRRQDRVWRPNDYDELTPTQCAPPGYTLLRDVQILPGGLTLAADGRFVKDDRTRLTPPTVWPAFARFIAAGPEGRLTWPVAPQAIKKGILASGPGSNVYGHQLLDYLPGLALLEQVGAFADWPVLLRQGAPSWVIPMIEEFVGRRREIKVIPGGRARLRTDVGQLCVPWVVRSPSLHPIVRKVFSRIVEAAKAEGDEPVEASSRKLYVVRGEGDDGSEKRRLINRAQVEGLFTARGFELIRPELLSFKDQVRLFAGAEVVAGEGGSGLHGVIFSAEGSVTLELRPASYKMLAQPAIAILQRQTFASVMGVDAVDEGQEGQAWPPWTLELEALEERLAELEL